MNTKALILLAAAAPVWAQSPNPTNCPQIQDATKSVLINRVRARYSTEPSAAVQLTDDSLVAGSCYHRLIFEIQSARQSYSLPLYLSPDQRYLTRDLTEVRTASSNMMASAASASPGCGTAPPTVAQQPPRAPVPLATLVNGAKTAAGSPTAPATLVIFSDFQCPYCKRSADWLKAETQQFDTKQLRVVYRFFPLSFHQWAKPAAEAAACVASQSPEAFWKFHDAIFTNQTSINPGNVQDKLAEFAQGVPGLRMAEYKKCVESGQSAQAVESDQRLGASLQVRGTPTIFLNGVQMGLQSPGQLHAAIEGAVKGPVQVASAGR